MAADQTRDSRWRRLRRLVAGYFELPHDVAMDLSRVTLVGDLQVSVENHRGIVEYRPDLVRINVVGGQLLVRGDGLSLGSLLDQEITVNGHIRGLELSGQ